MLRLMVLLIVRSESKAHCGAALGKRSPYWRSCRRRAIALYNARLTQIKGPAPLPEFFKAPRLPPADELRQRISAWNKQKAR